MTPSSVLTTLALGVAALFAAAPADAALTTGLTTYDAMTIYVRRDMHAVAHATLETKNPKLIAILEAFVTNIENSLLGNKMNFDTYRTVRKATYDKYTTVVSSSRVNDLVKRVGALTTNDVALNDLSLALYAPAAVSDVFFDVADGIANTINAKEFQQLAKEERTYVEEKIKANVNPVWVAAHLHGVLERVRALNESYALQLDNTRATIFRSLKDEYGNADL